MSRAAEREARRDADTLTLRQPRGAWTRFFVLLWHARIPIVMIAILFVVSLVVVNVGLDQSAYTAALMTGDVAVSTVTMLVVTMIVAWALGAVSGVLTGIVEQRINRNLRRLIWRSVIRLPLSFFRTSPPREVVSRITTDTDTMGPYLMTTIYPIVVSAYTVWEIARRLFEFDPRLSWAALTVVPLFVFLTWLIGRLRFTAQRNVATHTADLTQRLAEYVVHLPLIKAFVTERRERERGDALVSGLYRSTVTAGVITAVSSALFTTVGLARTIVLVVVGALLLNGGELTTEQWATFFLYAGTLAGTITTFTSAWENSKAIQGTTDRIGRIVYAPSEPSGTRPAPASPPEIVLNDVSYSYGDDHALRGLTHTFAAGKLTVVVGPNGSGKSTLLGIVERLHTPDGGAVLVDATPVDEYDLRAYRASFAAVSPDGPIVSGTVRDNLVLGLGRVPDDATLLDALSLGGRRQPVDDLADGLDTQVGDAGIALSGGARHRIALARAIVSDRPLILLDEPTSASDAVSTSELLDVIRDAMRGRTTILVSHTPAALAVADEVIVVEDGRVTCSGTPAHVVEASAFVREAFAEGSQR